MGRKWTNVLFRLENRQGTVREASSDPNTQEEALYEFIQNRWDEDNAHPAQNIDVSWGWLKDKKLERYLSEISEECPYVQMAGVVQVTDSAHIGYGKVFECTNGTVEEVGEYNGYEGAHGEAAAGKISEEHSIHVNPEWCW